jgi:hypothetical protein
VPFHTRSQHRGFTLIEVALIVAIIGMMLLIIVGYFMAPKNQGPLPPVAAFTPIPSSAFTSTPIPATPIPKATPKTIELGPAGSPIFR